jgi:hypothetical protein
VLARNNLIPKESMFKNVESPLKKMDSSSKND